MLLAVVVSSIWSICFLRFEAPPDTRLASGTLRSDTPPHLYLFFFRTHRSICIIYINTFPYINLYQPCPHIFPSKFWPKELLQLIFWFLLPWVLWIFLYLSALCFVRLRLCKDRSFLKSCLRFYEDSSQSSSTNFLEDLACGCVFEWILGLVDVCNFFFGCYTFCIASGVGEGWDQRDAGLLRCRGLVELL